MDHAGLVLAMGGIRGEFNNNGVPDMKIRKGTAAVFAVAVLCGPMTAHGALLMQFQEVNGNVVGALSGSLDLAGMEATPGQGSAASYLQPALGIFGTGSAGDPQTGYYDQISGPAAFGDDIFTASSSNSGDAVFL